MLLIRLTLLRQLLPAAHAATLEAAAAARWLAVSPPVVKRLGRWLKEMLARTRQPPEMLRHPAAIETLERELVQGLVNSLGLTTGPTAPERGSLRRRGFDRAIECIRYADLTTLDLTALCTAAGVSQRTLAYAFREHLGLSPAAFIRQLRLHGLRRELLVRRLGEASVTDVAYHLGFTQLGRLSGDYRRTFGELPSDTLARTLTDDVPPFWIDGMRSRLWSTVPRLG